MIADSIIPLVARTLVVAENIQRALERIATAQEQQLANDPLTVLHEAVTLAQAGDRPDTIQLPHEDDPDAQAAAQALTDAFGTRPDQPAAPHASTAITKLYRHPNPGWEIVASRDKTEPSGWAVMQRQLPEDAR